MNTRYIVVLFYKDIGYTLQMDDKPRVFFEKYAKTYKKLGSAIKKANKLFYQYSNDCICVFMTRLGEELSCDKYKEWRTNKERLMWNSNTWFGNE